MKPTTLYPGQSRYSSQDGLSLIELMISITLGLMLLAEVHYAGVQDRDSPALVTKTLKSSLKPLV